MNNNNKKRKRGSRGGSSKSSKNKIMNQMNNTNAWINSNMTLATAAAESNTHATDAHATTTHATTPHATAATESNTHATAATESNTHATAATESNAQSNATAHVNDTSINSIDGWVIDRSGTNDAIHMNINNNSMSNTSTNNTIDVKVKIKKTRRGGQSKNSKKNTNYDNNIDMNNYENEFIDFIDANGTNNSAHYNNNTINTANNLFLDPESHSYFMALEPVLNKISQDYKVNRKNTSQNDDLVAETQDHQLLLQNLFENELDDFSSNEKLAILCDFGTSRVLQKILDCPLVTHDQIRGFATLLANTKCDDQFFSSLVCHQFGSHVFQTILEKAGPIIEAEIIAGDHATNYQDSDTLINENFDHDQNESQNTTQIMSMQEFIKIFVEKLMPYWCDFMTHVHGTHILRSLLNLLAGGAYLDKQTSRSKKSRDYSMNHDLSFKSNKNNTGVKKSFLVPTNFASLLSSISNSIISHLSLQDGGIRSISTHHLANPVLQLLLSVPQSRNQTLMALFPSSSLKKSPDCLEFVDKIVYDTVGSHLMEKILLKADTPSSFESKLVKSLFKNYFQSRILELCDHPLSNFVLQALLPTLEKEEQVKLVLDTLLPRLYDLIFGRHGNRMGVLVRMVEVCVFWPKLQASVCLALEEAFGVSGDGPTTSNSDEELEKKRLVIAPLILHIRTYQQFQERVFVHRPHTLGSLLLQHLLKFSHPHNLSVSKSIASLSANDLLLWCRDATCSPIIEHFFHSSTISSKLKHQLFSTLRGSIKLLAVDKFGSHVLDTIFSLSSLEVRECVCMELVEAGHTLSSSFHAGFVLRNCLVELFKRRRDEWETHQRGLIKEVKEGKKSEKKSGIKKEKKDEIDLIFSK